MTVKRYWKMSCDICGTVYPETFEDLPVKEVLRMHLEPDGWKRKRLGNGQVDDYCPDCARALEAEAEAEAEAPAV